MPITSPDSLIRACYWKIYYCEEMGKDFPV